MKQGALTTTSGATTQVAIAFITHWVEKYSFLFVRYANWSICITADKQFSTALDFDLSYAVESNAAASEVMQYFKDKGMHADSANDTGRYIPV